MVMCLFTFLKTELEFNFELYLTQKNRFPKMAQTRLEKIGTIYSRMSGLLRSGAMKAEHKPVWFEVYEAFPPKYEPRFDRHQLPYGEGGNVEAMGPPRKIFYKEDLIRAKFYKVCYKFEIRLCFNSSLLKK